MSGYGDGYDGLTRPSDGNYGAWQRGLDARRHEEEMRAMARRNQEIFDESRKRSGGGGYSGGSSGSSASTMSEPTMDDLRDIVSGSMWGKRHPITPRRAKVGVGIYLVLALPLGILFSIPLLFVLIVLGMALCFVRVMASTVHRSQDDEARKAHDDLLQWQAIIIWLMRWIVTVGALDVYESLLEIDGEEWAKSSPEAEVAS